MADAAPYYKYKETRLNLESTIPEPTITIRLPSDNWTSRTVQKRSSFLESAFAQDENEFKRKNLASAASIYNRRYHNSPRSFLWRVIDNGRVLSIQAVDLCRQDKVADANLTLQFIFPSQIKPACVALADSAHHDVLRAFVLTDSHVLYTLTLRPDYFRKHLDLEDNASDWCKTYLAAAFSFKKPHRLAALSGEELLVSFHDGGMLKLDMAPGDDTSTWNDKFYSEGNWKQGIRSLIPFQGNNTVRHGNTNFELSAVLSMTSPAIEILGSPYVFTVSLDHRIRVWNLASGKISYVDDMLDQERTPNDSMKHVIDPSASRLIKSYQIGDDRILVVSYSPLGAGCFKFWSAIPGSGGDLKLSDLFPGVSHTPPAPTSDIWTIADFSAVVSTQNSDDFSLWVLWKNNLSYRINKLEDMLAWNTGWFTVDVETILNSPTPSSSPSDPEDCTEKWLEYILFPGRFTLATIEAALSIYDRSLGGSKPSSQRTSNNVAERMCSLVASTTAMERNASGHMEYEKFKSAADTQWRRFHRLLLELDKKRGEAVSLAFDTENELPWVILADAIGALRECSVLESEWHNQERPGQISVSNLLTAASEFRNTFSDSLLYTCRTLLNAELFQDPSATISTRIRDFYNRSNLGGQISDEDYAQLLANLGGNFRGLTNELYRSLFQMMFTQDDFDQRIERHPFAGTGMKAAIRGVQEMADLQFNICFDQLMLLIFMEADFDQQEEGLQLDVSPIYNQLLAMLKRAEFLRWMGKTLISVSIPKTENSINTKERSPSPSRKPEVMKTITVLEGCVAHLLGLVVNTGEPVSRLLTEMLVRLCNPDSDYDIPPVLIQCWLLKMERPDLASDASCFCNQDPFSVYVQGRVSLAVRDMTTASIYFKKAAFELSHINSKKGLDHHSSGLLNDSEWKLFNAGLPRYYYHIMSLFEKDRAFSYVIDFARLALQFATASAKASDTVQLRSELLSRMFSACVQTSRYDAAYMTLCQLTDHPLQKSLLRSLIVRMCETSCVTQMINLPFLHLQDAVDEILSQRCQSASDAVSGVPYHKILYAWRVKRNDFRGAAAVSLERLQRLQKSSERAKGMNGTENDAETLLTMEYLGLINVLNCVDPEQAWILSEEIPEKLASGSKKSSVDSKRTVVTIESVRRNYQRELDRMAAIENDQFAFANGDEMDM